MNEHGNHIHLGSWTLKISASDMRSEDWFSWWDNWERERERLWSNFSTGRWVAGDDCLTSSPWGFFWFSRVTNASVEQANSAGQFCSIESPSGKARPGAVLELSLSWRLVNLLKPVSSSTYQIRAKSEVNKWSLATKVHIRTKARSSQIYVACLKSRLIRDYSSLPSSSVPAIYPTCLSHCINSHLSLHYEGTFNPNSLLTKKKWEVEIKLVFRAAFQMSDFTAKRQSLTYSYGVWSLIPNPLHPSPPLTDSHVWLVVPEVWPLFNSEWFQSDFSFRPSQSLYYLTCGLASCITRGEPVR